MLLTGFNKAYAETTDGSWKTTWQWLKERGSIENNPYAHSGTADGSGFTDNIGEAVELWKTIGEYVLKIIEWFNNLPENIVHMSVNLLGWCYKTLVTVILHTPTFLFENSWFKDNIYTFTTISVGIFTIFTIITRINGMFNPKNKTELKEIIKKYALVVVGIGFSPMLFEKGFYFLNKISSAITSLGYYEVTANDFSSNNGTDWINVFALLGFDAMLLATLIPILLQNGRRWFDLICLGAMTPLALSAWVFDEHRHHFRNWWDSIKKIGMVQLVYATFLAIMGVFMLGTRGVVDGTGLILKLVIIAGGLWRMSNPPAFMLRMADTKQTSITDMYKDFKGIVTLSKFRNKPMQFLKGTLMDGMNKGKMTEARSELGKRSIGTPTDAHDTLKKTRLQKARHQAGKRYLGKKK